MQTPATIFRYRSAPAFVDTYPQPIQMSVKSPVSTPLPGDRARQRTIYRVTLIGSLVNLVLSIAKFVAGICGHSSAMVADAIHSLSDLATDVVVLCFIHIAAKPIDEDHDYGHGKYETLATLLIGLALVGVSGKLLWNASTTIRSFFQGAELPRPGAIALWASAISIVAKELLFRYTVHVAHAVQSPAIEANAWHHRSDALSSLGTLIGIGCAYLLGGAWRLADPIAAIVVSLLILYVALHLIRMGLDELLEKSLSEEEESRILTLITENPLIQSPHNLRTRRIGPNISIEVHVRVDAEMTVRASHQLTIEIEQRLREVYGPATLVSIHVEPTKP